MDRTYRMGKRFQSMKYICVGLEVVVLAFFHMFYQYLFPSWNRMLLGTAFAVFAVVVAWGTLRFWDWLGARTWYETTPEGLIVNRGRRHQMYPWNKMKSASLDPFALRAVMPVVIEMENGEKFTLEQYLEGLGTLTQEIIRRTEGHAQIEEKLVERLKTAQAVHEKKQRH